MKSLNDLGVKHGTGKSSLWVNYLWFYDLLFRGKRLFHLNILEVGVQFGYSLRTWRDYFPYSHIIGIDAVSNNVQFRPDEGIEMVTGDAYSPNMLSRIEGKFDIIIDDGDHNIAHQLWFVQNYPSLLADDGLLFVEDILSKDTVNALGAALPAGFEWTHADFTRHAVDGLLFIAWKKPNLTPPQSEPASATDHPKT